MVFYDEKTNQKIPKKSFFMVNFWFLQVIFGQENAIIILSDISRL